MLITKDILEKFNEYCYKIQIEFNRLEYTDRVSNVWDDNRKNKYRFGVVQGLLEENDNNITKLLDYDYDRNILYILIKKQFNKKQIENRIKFEKLGLPELYKQCDFSLSVDDDIYEWVKKYHFLYFKPVKNRSKKQQLVFLLLYLSYDDYRNNKKLEIEEVQPNLDGYSNKNNYSLIDIDENIIQIPEICNRLYDRIKDKTIFCTIESRFAKILFDLKKDGYICNMSFKGKNDYIFDGYVKTEPLCEEIERGILFTWDIEKLSGITKLYNADLYNNNMWIKVSDTDITFEEMLDNELIQNDNKITNVLHLRYYKKDDKYYISHLDHEYIYYTGEEYDYRIKNYNQKGHKRIKTFKIDNSSIPMDYCCELLDDEYKRKLVPFLYYVINLYFSNKQLVEEYFSENKTI